MSDPLAVKSTNPVLAWGTATGVVGLALGGFVLSFQALRDLAIASGIMPELAFIWPLIVDGFIVVATASAFALKRRGRQVTWYPWSALILFSAISVAGNASHAVSAQDVTVPVWVATVVSSVPAIALLIASHLLVVMIDGKARGKRKEPTTGRTVPLRGRSREPETAAAPATPVAGSSAMAAGVAGQRPLRAVESGEGQSLADRVAAVVADGGQISGALIARLEGVSERTGRRRMQELRESNPELFEDTRQREEALS